MKVFVLFSKRGWKMTVTVAAKHLFLVKVLMSVF